MKTRNPITVKAGIPTFQTKPLSLAKAGAFAKCLSANPRFIGVEILPCAKAAGMFRVYYLPANPARAEAVAAAYQEIQTIRAAERKAAGKYTFSYIGEGVWAIGSASRAGVEHTTTEENCTCEHFRYRLAGTGMDCTHMEALRFHMISLNTHELEVIQIPTIKAEPIPAASSVSIHNRAELQRMFN